MKTIPALILPGLVVAPFYMFTIIILGALEPGYSHLTLPMSLLGGVPGLRGLAFNISVMITGVLIILFAIGLWQHLTTKTAATLGLGLLVLGGFGLIGAGYFHCNTGCKNILAEPDAVGQLHIICSFLAGLGTALAPFFFWLAMRQSEKWQQLAIASLLAAILANLPGIIFWLTILSGHRLEPLEGLLQRLGFIIILLWMFYVATRLWRQSTTQV